MGGPQSPRPLREIHWPHHGPSGEFGRSVGEQEGLKCQEGLAAAGASGVPGTVAAAGQELEGQEGLMVISKHPRVHATVGTVSTTGLSGSMSAKHAHQGDTGGC